MPLSRRARVFYAAQNNVPAEDALRFVHPKFYLPVLRSAFATYVSPAASNDLKFVAVLSEKSRTARPASRWEQSVRPPQEVSPPEFWTKLRRPRGVWRKRTAHRRLAVAL